jgi:hypothetical protein
MYIYQLKNTVPLWWEMLIVGKALHVGAEGQLEVSVISTQFAVNLKLL